MDLLTSPNLVFYAPLWEKDGGVFYAEDARGHACTVTNAVWTKEGRYFDGAGDYISCGNNADLAFTSQDFTIMVWFKTISNAGSPVLVCKGVHLSDGYFGYIDNTGKLNFLTEQAGAAQTTNSNTGFSVNNWHNAIITRIGASVRIYKNLEDVSLTMGSHLNPLTNTRNFKIGILDDNASQPMNGYIGEVWVFNKVLGQTEREKLYFDTKWRYR